MGTSTDAVRTLVIRHRKSGYTTTICPFDEDSKYWYAIETKCKKILDTCVIQSLISISWVKNNTMLIILVETMFY